eukprot:scaffold7500_cov127-Isochrysis_galbana.AAC.17
MPQTYGTDSRGISLSPASPGTSWTLAEPKSARTQLTSPPLSRWRTNTFSGLTSRWQIRKLWMYDNAAASCLPMERARTILPTGPNASDTLST